MQPFRQNCKITLYKFPRFADPVFPCPRRLPIHLKGHDNRRKIIVLSLFVDVQEVFSCLRSVSLSMPNTTVASRTKVTTSSAAKSPTLTTNMTRFQVKRSRRISCPKNPIIKPAKSVPEMPRLILPRHNCPMVRPVRTAKLMTNRSFLRRSVKNIMEESFFRPCAGISRMRFQV